MVRQLYPLLFIFSVFFMHSCIENASADSGKDKGCQQGIMRAKNDLSNNNIRITIPRKEAALKYYYEEMIYRYYGKEIQVECERITCGTDRDDEWDLNKSCYDTFMDSIVSGFGTNVFQRVKAGADSLYQLYPNRYPEYGIKPSFPGGDTAMHKALTKNIHYPPAAKKDSIQGKVFVKIQVDEQGKVSKATVLKGVRPDLDSAAVSGLLLIGDFQPALRYGKASVSEIVIPVNFVLK